MLKLKNVQRIIDIRTLTIRDLAKEVFGASMADLTADGQIMIAGPMAPHVITDLEEAQMRKRLKDDKYIILGELPTDTSEQLPLDDNKSASDDKTQEPQTGRPGKGGTR